MRCAASTGVRRGRGGRPRLRLTGTSSVRAGEGNICVGCERRHGSLLLRFLGGSISCIALAIASAASRSEEHTSELQSLMRISYAVFCLKKKKKPKLNYNTTHITMLKRSTTRRSQK